MEKKKSIFKKWWFWVIIVVVIGGIAAAGGGSKDEKNKNTGKENVKNEESKGKPADTEKEEPQDVTEPYEITLKAGCYTVGVDIPEGTYTLTAVAGSGNVNSSNMFSGGLNEIMAAQPDEYSVAEFKNAKMESGITLKLSGTIELKLSCNSAAVSKMEARNNPLSEEIELGSGNYIAGTDFPAGEYDIIAIDGNGNVNSSNMFDGGLNEIFSTAADGYSISEFKNARFDEGVELKISSCTVKLVPSK